MESAFSGEDVATFCRLNAFKYVWRSTAHKDSADVNVRKAIWFLERSLKYSTVTKESCEPRTWEIIIKTLSRRELDVYRCVQEKMCTRKNVYGAHSLHVYKKNGAAIKEFFDVYNMCTDVYRCVQEKKMAPPLRSFLMCTRCVQMCTGCFFWCVQDVYKCVQMCTGRFGR